MFLILFCRAGWRFDPVCSKPLADGTVGVGGGDIWRSVAIWTILDGRWCSPRVYVLASTSKKTQVLTETTHRAEQGNVVELTLDWCVLLVDLRTSWPDCSLLASRPDVLTEHQRSFNKARTGDLLVTIHAFAPALVPLGLPPTSSRYLYELHQTPISGQPATRQVLADGHAPTSYASAHPSPQSGCSEANRCKRTAHQTAPAY